MFVFFLYLSQKCAFHFINFINKMIFCFWNWLVCWLVWGVFIFTVCCRHCRRRRRCCFYWCCCWCDRTWVALAEQFVEALVTVGLIVLLFECAFVELFQAESTHKMFRMEFSEHGCNAAAGDGLGAASTKWSTFRVVMRLTVWQSFVIEKWSILERLTAILQWNKNKNIHIIHSIVGKCYL